MAKEPRAKAIWFEEDFIYLRLTDGREVKTPIVFYPTLASATKEQRENFRLFGIGTGLHWPDLDEDLSAEGIVQGRKGIVRLVKQSENKKKLLHEPGHKRAKILSPNFAN